MDLSRVLRRALGLSALLSAGVALIGGIVGALVAGGRGVVSALIGAAIGLVFFGITTLSVLLGRRLGGVGMIGVVAGGWMVKVAAFLAVLIALREAPFIQGQVLFFCLVAVAVGTVLIDAVLFMRSRVPLFDEDPGGAPPSPGGRA